MALHKQTVGSSGSVAGNSRRFLSFRLGDELYGLDILKIQEILQLVPITHIPRVPDYVSGVINLRGQVIPIIDAKLRFDIQSTCSTGKPCIVVIQVESEEGNTVFGLQVDEVRDVVSFQAEDIQPPLSQSVTSVDSAYVQGIGIRGKDLVILLEISKIFASSAMSLLKDAVTYN